MAAPAYPLLALNHPASIQFAAWLTAFNTVDQKALLEYHADAVFPYSVASRDVANIDRESLLAELSGGFDIVKIESDSEPSTVVVVMKEKSRLQHARATMVVDTSKDNLPATKFDINPISPVLAEDDPRRHNLNALTDDTRRALVNAIAEILRNQYVTPDTVEAMVSTLETYLKNGDYSNITEHALFAHRLTDDLQSSGNDKHMQIVFSENLNHNEKALKQYSPVPEEIVDDLRRMNFGFLDTTLDTSTVPGRTIATLPITSFVGAPPGTAQHKEIQAEIGKILSGVADAHALILDLRDNRGGDPRTVALVLSCLLDDGPVHILDFVDRNGKIFQSSSTLSPPELPEGISCYGGTKPLFVLTTGNTISGGEELTYDLQAFKRSNAIIGEGNDATAGAANPVFKPQIICEEIFGPAWSVRIPTTRPVHVVTGTNWEGVGVLSDTVAGKGVWADVSRAEEVAKKLIKRMFEGAGPEKTEL